MGQFVVRSRSDVCFAIYGGFVAKLEIDSDLQLAGQVALVSTDVRLRLCQMAFQVSMLSIPPATISTTIYSYLPFF